MRRSIGTSQRGNMRHGLISLLTVVVVLSLSTAAVLAVATSHAMGALSQRQATMTAEGYAAEQSAQALLAGLDEVLAPVRYTSAAGSADVMDRVQKRMNSLLVEACAEGITATYEIDNNVLTCTFVTEGGRQLEVSASIDEKGGYQIVSWLLTAAPEEEETGDVLWTGSATGETGE